MSADAPSDGLFPDGREVRINNAYSLPSSPIMLAAVHELGHSLGFAHTLYENSNIRYQYNNSMDFMSGGSAAWGTVGKTGTNALNRYMVGWIDADEVALHQDGTATYQLTVIGAYGGDQLLVFPSDTLGEFEFINPRLKTATYKDLSYDSGIPHEGIEHYSYNSSFDPEGTVYSTSCGDYTNDWFEVPHYQIMYTAQQRLT